MLGILCFYVFSCHFYKLIVSHITCSLLALTIEVVLYWIYDAFLYECVALFLEGTYLAKPESICSVVSYVSFKSVYAFFAQIYILYIQNSLFRLH